MNVRNLIIVCGIVAALILACLITGIPLWWGIIASVVLNFFLGFKIPIWPRR